MKKSILGIIIIMAVGMTVIPASVQEKPSNAGESYADPELRGYDEAIGYDTLLYAVGIPKTKNVIYDRIIIPPAGYFYRESVSGSHYSGILNLTGYVHVEGRTIATYSGVLIKNSGTANKSKR